MPDRIDHLACHRLNDHHAIYCGRLPPELMPNQDQFQVLWRLHPDTYHQIMIHGRLVNTPRWQQAYGFDYHYSRSLNKALPLPELLHPLLAWCKDTVDRRLNGILLNWYDGKLKHYIGRHRDSTDNMVPGTPIVTVSFGDTRTFRLRPWKGKGFVDFTIDDGTVFVMPYESNLHWTHEVPYSVQRLGRRVSVTLRAFSG
ncbi:MAG: alpha-ketoglutarate-dependent dioxygenase AlkB [Candidatus Andersenbacteria bacterium]|nr:alpha-ketoglutarate-dependent dioxygenase AlkB [Candidatus Andersenbacteria bacterium]